MSGRSTPRITGRRPSGYADRKRQFRETARDILHMAKVKRQSGEAVDAADAVSTVGPAVAPHNEALDWTLIPPRTRGTFWSICLAALGREGKTATPSYLEAIPTRGGTLAWQLVVPDRQPYEKRVGDGTITTLFRLGLMDYGDDETLVVLTDYGIRTWNRFCERGGQWPDDLVEKLP